MMMLDCVAICCTRLFFIFYCIIFKQCYTVFNLLNKLMKMKNK